MKKNLGDHYSFHDKFILRTPVLPLKISKMSVEELFNYTKQPFFIEALYLASPVLHNELIKWHHGKLSDKKKPGRLISSLYKYYNRMQSRCTPYGLFAACSTGTWGEENNIRLNTATKRHTRLDMNYLCALAQQLNRHEAILPRLQFYPNNSMYSFGGQLRYVEYNYVNNKRVHQLSSVTQSTYLQLLLEKAENGLHIEQLCNLLTDDEITYEEAEAFVNELIENQILVSELEPAVTGDEFIYQIISTLKKINSPLNDEIQAIVQLLEKVQNNIAVIDEKIGNPTSAYREIYRELQALNASIEENQLFQTDLYRIPEHASLNSDIKTNLAEAISFLNALNIKREDENLKTFRNNFYSQYEDAEIPLLEALDTETGVGYKGKDSQGINVLLEDIYTGNGEPDSYTISWNKEEELLHKKLTDALKNDQYTVRFTDEDAQKINAFSNALPNTFSVMFKVLNNDNKIYIQNCGGPSAAYLLGRFAHGDPTIHNITTEITTHEQKLNPDKIYAEIVHLPESRIGNILLRPVLRNYEIPYLGRSALPAEQQIPLQDLYVSVRRDTILLRSKKHNKEIIPRMSTAHNYSFNALPAYQFLGDIQTQYTEKYSLRFHWGELSNMYTFLPRVEYKNVILSKAKWQFRKKEFKIILQNTTEEGLRNINNWRIQWKIPDQVVLADTDNTLLINFQDPLSIKMLADTIKQRDNIILEEFLFDTEDTIITDENGGHYTNECIALLLKNKPGQDSGYNINTQKTTENIAGIQRNFALGSEWLYYKFYCGIKTGDQFLAEVVKPLTETLTAQKRIDKFFFLRYADPQTHIRLRFQINDPDALGEVIKTVSEYVTPYLEQGLITKIQTDTYNRELERYGSNSITTAESFFHIDSVITLQLLDAIEGDAGEEIRWQFGIRSVDELLDNFKYTLPDKLTVLENLKNSFINEHGGHKELKQQLGAKYRKLRKPVEAILNRDLDGQREIFPLIQLLIHKSEQMKPIAATILRLKNNRQLQLDLNDLMSSYIHMLLNRLFKARQRTHEMVIYDFLHNHYKSVLARQKNKNNPIGNKTVTET